MDLTQLTAAVTQLQKDVVTINKMISTILETITSLPNTYASKLEFKQLDMFRGEQIQSILDELNGTPDITGLSERVANLERILSQPPKS
jgi:hypothetical protein